LKIYRVTQYVVLSGIDGSACRGAHTVTLPTVSTPIVYPVSGGTAVPAGSLGKLEIYVGTKHPKSPAPVPVVVAIPVGPETRVGQVYELPPTVKVPLKTPLLSAILCPTAFRIELTEASL
jgi:hypothetical protein